VREKSIASISWMGWEFSKASDGEKGVLSKSLYEYLTKSSLFDRGPSECIRLADNDLSVF
jgi:hypothetical protein